MNSLAAQARQNDAIRKFQAAQDNTPRQREQANLDFQKKVNKNQRKDQKRLLKHQRHQHLIHKLADAAMHRYEEDEDFKRFIDQGIEKSVTAVVDGYRRWKETGSAENAHPSSAGSSIVDYPVEVTWDDSKQNYRMVKGRE
jgi:hypothetical protein